jgi:hypothetical protein
MSTIVTRAGKGSALTHNEVDANFTNLNTDKIQSGNTVASLTVTSISGTTATYTNATISSADINGGTIDGAAIGSSSASSGAFTTLSSTGNTTLGNASGDTVTITGTVQPGMVISGSSSSDALRITQTGTGNALLVEDSASPDSTPFVIDAVGRVINGHTASLSVGVGGNLGLQLTGSGGAAGQTLARFDNSAPGARMQFLKSRSATIGSSTIVDNGDDLGYIDWYGDDGSANYASNGGVHAARIFAEVDGTPGTNDMPGRLVFSTTADGASTPTERMRITNAGNVGIGASAAIQRLDVRNSDGAAGVVAGFGNTSIATALQILTSDGNLDWGFNALNSRNLVFQTNQTERMRITSTGNVGIGTSTPAVKLNVVGGATSGAVNDAALFGGGVSGVVGSGAAIYLSGSNDVSRGVEIAGVNTGGANNAHAMVFSTSAATAAPTERMRIDSSGNVGIGDTTPSYKLDVTGDINVTGDFRKGGTVFAGLTGGQTGSAPLYGARAWVNFNGTGTVAIRASGNVSSITDNGTGDYTVNFATAMPDANYSIFIGRTVDFSAYPGGGIQTLTTTTARILPQRDTSGFNVDTTIACVSIFR